jgi:uncharacterized protein (TIGR02757 family)
MIFKSQPADIKEFLEEKASQYNNPVFIETDPISVPHSFTLKEDIEISGFLTSVIAWGNRKMIIRNATRLMDLMDNAPFDFVLNHSESDLNRFNNFVHRTFNGDDARYFMKALKHIYINKGGLERIFSLHATEFSTQNAIHEFRKEFFSLDHPLRTTRHISDPAKGSAAKRINMFLRWVVRNDNRGVDFGLWKSISPRQLSCPVDIHSGNVARKLGLITRKQNDAVALRELDTRLREMDNVDPVRYDFALFGLGVFEKF